MAIDIRATVSCSLGTLISAQISDDYLQGNGLVLVRGSAEISGLITPAVGTAVTFSYTKGGVTRSIPRKLRVLSSFADPFRRTTSVQLGCKLTYLSDLREKVDWTAVNDTRNTTYDSTAGIVWPIHAPSVAERCLSKLGITANSMPLNSRFSVARFSFASGWVSVLNDLLVSENYCGYLDGDEVLQIFSLDQAGGTGPVLDSTNLIDIGQINSGQLPGEAVVVGYSALKLKRFNRQQKDTWDQTITTDRNSVLVAYTKPDGSQGERYYNTLDRVQIDTTYTKITTPDNETLYPVASRLTQRTQSSASELGGYMSQVLTAGLPYNNSDITSETSEFFYYDEYGNETLRVTETLESKAAGAGSLNLPFVLPNTGGFLQAAFLGQGKTLKERVIVKTTVVGDSQQIITERYGPWVKTLSGQQSVAEGKDSFTRIDLVEAFINQALKAERLLERTVRIEQRRTATETAPSPEARINAASGSRFEQKSSLALALGSPIAQRRVELALPLAPDDYFFYNGPSPGQFGYRDGGAAAAATAFGRVQNRLLLGNRSGMNLQLAPELLPAAPFSPLVVQANGLSALYRCNASSWTMDASGVVASTDALFWGAVGGTGSFWFPVAPGITTLPTTPPVVDGQMTVGAVVPVWNETNELTPTSYTRLEVTSFPYSLYELSEATATTKTGMVAQRVLQILVPAGGVALDGVVPRVATGARVLVPAAAVALAGQAPAVSSGGSVIVPAAGVSVVGVAPDLVGRQKTIISVPAAMIAVAGIAPAVRRGAAVVVPAAGVAVAGVVPVLNAGAVDPNFTGVSLLLHMDGSNNSTTFTDSSSNGLTMTVVGDSKISTAQSKFGGAAGYFDGNGDYVNTPSSALFDFGGGASFTIEFWMYTSNAQQISVGLVSQRISGIYAPFELTIYQGALRWLIGNAAVNNWAAVSNSAAVFSNNTWHHVALVGDGTNLKAYVGGSNVLTTAQPSWISANRVLYIGKGGDAAFQGYIDDLRVTKGIARTITVPTAAYPDR